ncbi:UvrD-helicase domain-containing protein [Kocuria sp. M1R5S2]|uniref:UvrD-helicase domain-containing protein n=1 Tax=Kocuria rhizosphaerae TaxID=3376285 RepID=UPI0037A4A625
MTTETARIPLVDEPARETIRHELGHSVFVEAGAGSGKTREMVQRVVALVDGGTPITAVVAITFTEKAAGELRERVRTALATGHDDDAVRSRRGTALHDLDIAPIGTIHSFAARIIRENPLEARVPPGIETLDEIESSLAFEDRWQQIVGSLFGKPEHSAAMEVLFSCDMTMGNLRDTARAMDENWDRLPRNVAGTAAEADPAPWRELVAAREELHGARRGCTDPEDGMFTRTAALLEWAGALEDRREQGTRAFHGHLGNLPAKGKARGKKANWTNDIADVKALDERIRELAGELAAAHVRPALDLVLAVMAAVLHEAADERRRQGRLEFHDLLVLARDLLVGEEHAEVRQRLHDRYACLMIDEFQDTDPIQAEIALRLASSVSCGPDRWKELPVEGGRLFMVGDPKQSIYRFRRADIETYLGFQERAAADSSSSVASLRTNFRSVGPVLEWVNQVFGTLIEEEHGRQPAYVPLVPDPARPPLPEGFGHPVSVIGLTLPGAEDGGRLKAAEVHEREARHVAHTVLTALGRTGGPAWRHQDGRDDAQTRPVTEEDIAILLPTRTSLEVLEKALDEAGIVYRAEASSLVYGAAEVRELMLILQALANPADSGRLVLALRTSILGCGDDELAAWRLGGGWWNYRADAPEGLEDTRVARTMLALRNLSGALSRSGVADLMECILEQFLVLEAATDSPRHRETWRRLRFVVDQARAWGTATHGSLRDYLRWAETQTAEGARVKEAVVPETDAKAVRITTVHAAKGLEYPVVILAGTGSTPRSGTHHVLFAEDGTMEVSLKTGLTTAGHEELKKREKDMLAAERLRLLYVACTRAQSHLVVSMYTVSENGESSHAAQLRKAHVAGTPELPFEAVESSRRRAEAVPEERSWDEVLAEWTAVSGRWSELSRIEGSRSVTRVAHATPPPPANENGHAVPSPSSVEPPTGDDDAPAAPQLPSLAESERLVPLESPPSESRGALLHGSEFGTALHRLMELCDLADRESLDRHAPVVAELHGLPDTEALLACARFAWDSPPVRAAAAAEHWKELPVATIDEDGAVLEGVVDLLYREAGGDYVVVDYKTDMALSELSQEAYRHQLSLYAGQLEGITGGRVRELVLVCCQPTVRQVMTYEHVGT